MFKSLITKNLTEDSYGIISNYKKPYNNFIIQFNLYSEDWSIANEKATTWGDYHFLVSSQETGGYMLGIIGETNKMSFSYYNSGYNTITLYDMSLLSKGWHNITLLITDGTIKLFIDLIEVHSSTIKSIRITSNTIGLGRDTSNTGSAELPNYGANNYYIYKFAIFENVTDISNINTEMRYDMNTPNLKIFYDFNFNESYTELICPISGNILNFNKDCILSDKKADYSKILIVDKDNYLYSVKDFNNELNIFTPFSNNFNNLELMIEKSFTIDDYRLSNLTRQFDIFRVLGIKNKKK